jgi:hypothetical protein
MRVRCAAALIAFAMIGLNGATADAAELKVISAGAVRSVIAGMIDDYARRTGVKFDFTVGPTGRLRVVIASGEPADLIIASAPLMDELQKTGKMTPGSRTDLGRVGLGVVVRDGAPVPDLSTPEAFKQALVSARSIAYTNPALGGTSVLHLMALAERFGIKEIVIAKGARDRRQRRRRQGRGRQGGDRGRADQRDSHSRRAAGSAAPRAIAALHRVRGRHSGEQHRSGQCTRFRFRAHRSRHGGALEGGRFRAAAIASNRTTGGGRYCALRRRSSAVSRLDVTSR